MMRFISLGIIALLTFLIFIVVFAPASLVWRTAEQQVISQVPDLHVLRVGGTVWSGEAELVYRQFPTSQLEWLIEALPLLKGQLVTELRLQGEGHDFSGMGNISQTAAEISSLTGYVDALYINRVSQPQGLTFAGRVSVETLSLESDLNWVQAVDGRIVWPGGKIVSRTRMNGTQVFDLPALTGDIRLRADVINLNIHHQNETVVDILLKPDGWVTVRVLARLFDIANLPWPAGSSPSDTVLEFEEKLFRGHR